MPRPSAAVFDRHVRAVEREVEGLLLGRHAGSAEPLLPLHERRLRIDQTMREQIFGRADRMPLEIGGRRERCDVFAAHGLHFEVVPVAVAVPDIDVVVAVRERHVFIGAGEIELQIAVGLLKRRQSRQQPHEPETRARMHAQDVDVGAARRAFGRAAQVRERARHVGQIAFAGRRQHEPAARALKQRPADQRFEIAQLMADGRRGQPEFLRRAVHAFGARDALERDDGFQRRDTHRDVFSVAVDRNRVGCAAM